MRSRIPSSVSAKMNSTMLGYHPSPDDKSKESEKCIQVCDLETNNVLNHGLVNSIKYLGYKTLTPIQSKVLSYALEGRDLVVMSRTGSGKTAAYLIPMFQNIGATSDGVLKALILVPTRDLAIQIMDVSSKLGNHTNLKCHLVVGGESLESQFATMVLKPDILIATPGRLVHLIREMSLSFQNLQFLVFDEADRLFEMGFSDQINYILTKISKERQTFLVSATLPKVLVDFTKAGLREPMLVRLDLDLKISQNLMMSFFYAIPEHKPALLLYLCEKILKKGYRQKTLIFCPSKHHAEYFKSIIESAGMRCAIAHSGLDELARRRNMSDFRAGRCPFMAVTDVASRGLDIPELQNVVNIDVPTTPKLFIHRIGRVARKTGVNGRSFTFVSSREVPHMIDLHLFLAKNVKYYDPNVPSNGSFFDGYFGKVPISSLSNQIDMLRHLQNSTEHVENFNKSENANKKIDKFAHKCSTDALVEAKKLDLLQISFHPLFTPTAADIASSAVIKLENRKLTKFGLNENLNAIARFQQANQLRKKPAFALQNKRQITNFQHKGSLLSADYTFRKQDFSKFADSTFVASQPTNHHYEKGLKLDGPSSVVVGEEFELPNDDPLEKNPFDSGRDSKGFRSQKGHKNGGKSSNKDSKRYERWLKRTHTDDPSGVKPGQDSMIGNNNVRNRKSVKLKTFREILADRKMKVDKQEKFKRKASKKSKRKR